ncbi:MAG: Extracellular solute-binding protein family 1 [Parcubacteria group bacterium GW2011_GWC2_42_12]|uniref:Extracellular solute-binding protein family 1 n=1 Tax=Candidatus Falkowbacteria bacterium GW2011_GWA2_41_14 TaxID=1618635 RepID=A0A0G0UT25_9BACT|nr:MAG: Extracellular solute-binding protein family 1 [Candidatus Falkowbacteria bacterium GW2011_GWA2_41_14]KKS33441.1 MAG: Extracellular solute-binding protein family 1 [Parcubacteria group bacterium GW2011_GWC2_42_12]
MKTKIITLSLLFIFLLTSGFGCKLVDQKTQEAMKPITLNYWRVWDGPDAFEEIFSAYKALHPFITINYRKLRYDEYENELLNALAEDRGPDIFSIHNTWLKKYKNKITPLPPTTTLAYPITQGTIKKEVIPQLRTTKSLNAKDIKNNFVNIVYRDVAGLIFNEATKKYEEKIYGLPLFVDTLAMYYNKDLFNNAGLAQSPAYWNNEFQQAVKKTTKQDTKGEIIQSGAGLGGSNNIERYSDILSVLMMQNGSVMADDDSGQVLFNKIPPSFKDQSYNPGLEALRFYTDFANPAKEVYSWNKNLDDSLNLFAQGKLAIMFGYSYHLATIRAQAPKLNFAITKLPQIKGNTPVNFANYWVETVSSKSQHLNEAWDFIQFATKAEQAKTYLDKAKRPTALRALINEQIDDDDMGVFAEQVLTAKSWYHGADSAAAEKMFAEMIDAAVLGQDKIETLINLAASKVQQTMNAGQ